MKCTRVLRRSLRDAGKYNLANSRARGSALPFGTTSAITPHSCAVRAVSGCGLSRKRLRSPRSSAITPRGEDSVTWHNASRKVRGHHGRSHPRPRQSRWPAMAYSECTCARPSMAAMTGTRMLAMFPEAERLRREPGSKRRDRRRCQKMRNRFRE